MRNAETVMYSNKHACRVYMDFEIFKIETTSSQKTSCHTHKVCVSDSSVFKICVSVTASFLATGGFVKLFHKIPCFSMIIQFFWNSMIFPCMELFCDFPGFP